MQLNMIDVLVSPGVPGPRLAQQKDTPALKSGLSSKELLSRLSLDNFLFINDSLMQFTGDYNFTIDFANRHHQHQLALQRRQLLWQRPEITETQTQCISSTPTNYNMASIHLSTCQDSGNREAFMRHEVSTSPSSFQNHPTPNASYPLTAPAMKTTHSSSGMSSSSQFVSDSFEVPESALANTKIDGSHKFLQSMAKPELNWPSKTLSFGSGTESSPSLSSSFDSMDVPKEEPIPYGLPLLDISFMDHTSTKTIIPQPQDTPFVADTLAENNNIKSSLQWSMDIETASWHPQYQSYRLEWPVPSTMTSSSWPISENMDLSCPDTQLIAPYNFTHNLLSTHDNHTTISSSASMPGKPDQSLSTPLVMGTFQPQLSNNLPTYTGLPSMPECSTSFPVTSSSTIHQKPPQLQPENPAIKASLHYSDARNALLIEWKRAGLSYKDIKRLGGFKEAESTLRGRFRTLTKAKEQRVRKPKWLKRDVRIPRIHIHVQRGGANSLFSRKQIQLLCEAVAACSGPVHPSSTGYTSLAQANMAMAMAGQPPKISWKKVGQYIWSHGGSYQFGNATCKKKWCDIHGIKI